MYSLRFIFFCRRCVNYHFPFTFYDHARDAEWFHARRPCVCVCVLFLRIIFPKCTHWSTLPRIWQFASLFELLSCNLTTFANRSYSETVCIIFIYMCVYIYIYCDHDRASLFKNNIVNSRIIVSNSLTISVPVSRCTQRLLTRHIKCNNWRNTRKLLLHQVDCNLNENFEHSFCKYLDRVCMYANEPEIGRKRVITSYTRDSNVVTIEPSIRFRHPFYVSSAGGRGA